MIKKTKLFLLTLIFATISSHIHCMHLLKAVDTGKTYRELQAKDDLHLYVQDNIALVEKMNVHAEGKGEGKEYLPFTIKKGTKMILPNQILFEQCFGKNTFKAYRKTFKKNEPQSEQLQWIIYIRNNDEKKTSCFARKQLLIPATVIAFAILGYLFVGQ